MIEYAIDVTERKQLQAQLHQSQKMETIGVLAGGIAHDFNNILTPILGYADIALMQLPPDSPVRDSLEQISSGGDRARNLVRQILTLSRQDNLDIESIDIGEVVQEDLSLLRASLPPNIEFDAYIDPECGFISANSAQISQVVMNLCTNAFHAMKEDGGTLTVRLQPFTVDQDSSPGLAPATKGKYIQLAVKDTGHGIDNDTLEKIFNPFFTTKDLGEGTGLGLSVVHGIVQAFDGEIFVDSVVDQGTAITIFLPEIDRNPDVTPVESKTDTRASGHILFVDDEQDIVHVAEQILSKLGYTLTAMTDSEEALELFKQDPATYDLAILDMMMPRMSGTELASAMLSIQPELQIIMATGLMTESSLNEFDQLGIKAKLSKPYNSKEVADVINSVLS
jgi:nitrogen-specific signal transduction histidine kinase